MYLLRMNRYRLLREEERIEDVVVKIKNLKRNIIKMIT